ncbi:MAG: redoxin domain-containing protein [Pirellulales bacterium]|nr:redoxin domain-containing protein [Pirellulales bacterium]
MTIRRRSALRLALSVAMLSMLACLPAGGRSVAAAETARRVDAFTLPDMHGRDRGLDELADEQIVVVAFLGVECPLARLYAPRLQELSEEYAGKRVAFVGIDSNQQDSLTDLVAFANKYGLKFPLLKDRDQTVADQFGATRTPEVFVLDAQRTIRYRGRIDDQYGQGSSSGYAKTKITRRDLASALDELLAGGEVAQPSTQVAGCLIGRKPKVSARGEVTYTKHIAAILEKHCVACHRPGEVGPFALTEYDEVVGWAEMIREVVGDGRMPPWTANPAYGHFANDARLSDDEKQLLDSWIDNGCPQGNLADLPTPRAWTDGWQISTPDHVVKMPRPFKVPAEGVVPYQHIIIDPGWTEDKWIQQVEARAGNRAVVHHIIAFVLPPDMAQQIASRLLSGGRGRGGFRPGDARRDDGEGGERGRRLAGREGLGGRGGFRGRGGPGGPGGERGGFLASLEAGGGMLTAYVPGSVGTVHEPGVATFVPKGSKIVLQMHYTPNGTAQEDQSYVGMVYADPATVKKRARGSAAINGSFAIPAGDNNYQVVSQSVIQKDQLLEWMSPHMHLRGKSFRFEAKYPDGSSEILLDVPRYDFNWQLRYVLAEPKKLPAGTVIECTAHFDNSAENVANPNPDEVVHWGPQTWEEMMIGFFGGVSVEDDAHQAGAKPDDATPEAPQPATENGGE